MVFNYKDKKIYIINIIKMKAKFKNLVCWFAVWLIAISNIITPITTAYDANSASTSFVMPDFNVTLKATSQANSYTIVFNNNWGAGTMANLAMTYNQSWTLTSNTFTKTWYTFQWWSTNSSASTATYTNWQSVKNLTSTNGATVTLYAIWKANTYKVSFDKNEGTDTINQVAWSMPVQNFTYDQSQQLTWNKFTRDWYTFKWWSTTADWNVAYADKASVNNLTATSGATVTLYAKWTANTWVTYTVNHYLMDTSGNYPANPSYTNTYSWTTYEIVTWARRNDEGMTLSWALQSAHLKWDGSTVFNYYYSRDKHTVTVHAGRWVQTVSGGGQYYYSGNVTVTGTLKPWYENLTWEWDKTTASFKMPATNVNMTWKATPITYTITYNIWSWEISWQPATYNVEQSFTLPNPTRTWYDFAWWTWTNQSTPKTWLTIPAWTYGNLTYTAVWTAKWDVAYKVHHYIKNVWTNTYSQTWATETKYGTADATVTLANLAKEIPCVTYAWWSLTASTSGLTNAITTTTVLPDGSREVYLYYTRNTHTLTLTKDTWISTVVTEWTYECGATVTVTATPAEWYHFSHWEVVTPTSWNPSL